jgi:hypothetical protein
VAWPWGTADTSEGVRCRHHTPRQAAPRARAARRARESVAAPPDRAARSHASELPSALLLPPSARAATAGEGHTRPRESTSGQARPPSARHASWKRGGVGCGPHSKWRTLARGLRGRARGSPGASPGAHAARTSAQRRRASSRCTATCWPPCSPFMRRRNPAQVSPLPSSRAAGPVHPSGSAHACTTGTSAWGVGPRVFPGRNPSSWAHFLATSAERTTSTTGAAGGRESNPASSWAIASMPSTVTQAKWHGRCINLPSPASLLDLVWCGPHRWCALVDRAGLWAGCRTSHSVTP